MGSLHSFEKTSMIQPDSLLANNYRSTKIDMQRISTESKSAIDHNDIMLEANERLNQEVQRLKKELNTKHASTQTHGNQPSQSALNAHKKVIVEKVTLKFQCQIKNLENQYNAEVKKNQLLNIKMGKLESLLDDVYDAEQENSLENTDIDDIKAINQQLTSLLEKLKS